MVRARIQNLSSFSRRHWVTVTFPTALVQDMGVECEFVSDAGDIWRAVRGRECGGRTVYRIDAEIAGGACVNGDLRPAMTDGAFAFQAHPWVLDDPAALVPSLRGYESEILSAPRLIDKSPAHLRFHTKFKIKDTGLILEWWADMLHNDPVMPCWGKLVWSDRSDTRGNRTFDAGSLCLEIGEYSVVDFAKRRGIAAPVQLENGKWASVLNDRAITLNDGAGIPLSLNLLPFESVDSDSPPVQTDVVDSLQQSIMNLQAAQVGNIVGACMEWDDYWCAAGNVPPAYANHEAQAAEETFAFHSLMHVNFGHFEPIGIGIGKTPGQTGAQEDFGAAKGTNVVRSGRVDYLPALQFASYYELYRGINHYEADGNKLRADMHPNWVTWSGRTHWHTGVSPDRLGKVGDPPPGTGWWGYDDQHRSQNNFAAYAMLSDDPLVDDQLEHQYEVDKACYRIRFPNNGAGAARAQGRQIGCWAQFMSITDRPRREDWKGLIDQRVQQCSTVATMTLDGPMKVLATIGPDYRKKIYRDGQLATTVSMWEHGLALVGLYKAYKVNQTPALKNLVSTVSQTMIDFAWFTENGHRYVVGDIIWNDGQAVDLKVANGWNESGENPMTQQFLYSANGAGINMWTMAGLRVAREFLDINDNQLDSLLDGAITTKSRAEWVAAVNQTNRG